MNNNCFLFFLIFQFDSFFKISGVICSIKFCFFIPVLINSFPKSVISILLFFSFISLIDLYEPRLNSFNFLKK